MEGGFCSGRCQEVVGAGFSDVGSAAAVLHNSILLSSAIVFRNHMLGGDLGDTAHYRVATGALGGVRLIGQHSIVTATPGMEDSPQSELSAYSLLNPHFSCEFIKL
jgi:hypothetical protein